MTAEDLDPRERAIFDEFSSLRPGLPQSWRPPATATPRRRLRRLSAPPGRPVTRALAAAALVALLAGGVGAYVTGRRASVPVTAGRLTPPASAAPAASPSAPTTSVPSATATPTAQPGPTASPAPTGPPSFAWVQTQYRIGMVLAAAVDGRFVYALVLSGDTGSPTHLVRLDRSAQTITTSAELPPYVVAQMVVSGGWLWLTGQTYPQSIATLRIDPASLRTAQTLQPPAAVLAGTATVLWAVVSGSLERLDPSTGAVLTRARGSVSAVGVSSTALYTVDDSGDPWTVSRRDSATGAVLDQQSLMVGVRGSAVVTAVEGGAWVAYRTGMDGWASFFPDPCGTGTCVRGPSLGPVGMGYELFATPGRLWSYAITQGGGGQTALSCLDPTRGSVRASTPASFIAVVVGDGSGTYAGSADGLALLRPPSAC